MQKQPHPGKYWIRCLSTKSQEYMLLLSQICVAQLLLWRFPTYDDACMAMQFLPFQDWLLSSERAGSYCSNCTHCTQPTLPVALCGICAMNTISSGTAWRARLPFKYLWEKKGEHDRSLSVNSQLCIQRWKWWWVRANLIALWGTFLLHQPIHFIGFNSLALNALWPRCPLSAIARGPYGHRTSV